MLENCTMPHHSELQGDHVMHINAQKLIMLRKRANLTAEALAEEAKIGRATITRIENGHTASHNSNTVKRLAKVLGCRPDDLGTAPEVEAQATLFASRRATPYEMSTACQNSLALVALRYDEKPEVILELAPLLFDIIARESLIERRQNLTELLAHREAISAMSPRFPHLSGRFTCDWAAEEFDHREDISIRRNDLRGEFVHADETLSDSYYPHDFDDECDNPFVAHLKRRCERLGEQGYEPPCVDAVSRWMGPVYELGLTEAKTLAGGEEDLAQAIVRGSVPITSIPKELMKDERLSDRQGWMRQRMSESAKQTSALLAELGLADILGE
jgi:transcriptional regulator with XRE-family HTH domain